MKQAIHEAKEWDLRIAKTSGEDAARVGTYPQLFARLRLDIAAFLVQLADAFEVPEATRRISARGWRRR